jgi:hypothetical protein
MAGWNSDVLPSRTLTDVAGWRGSISCLVWCSLRRREPVSPLRSVDGRMVVSPSVIDLDSECAFLTKYVCWRHNWEVGRIFIFSPSKACGLFGK